jgi:CBS domain containing-hemolysin-like protein
MLLSCCQCTIGGETWERFSASIVDIFDISWRLVVVVLLVLANGFFVASEFALVSVRRTRIDELVGEGNRRARVVKRSLGDLDAYIAATQLGITMASLALGWVGEPALARLLDPLFARILPEDAAFISAHGVAFVIAFAIITVLHIVFGELAPKTIALQRAEPTSLLVAGPLELFLRIFKPVIAAMNGLGRLVVRAIGLREMSGHALVHSEAELRMLVSASVEGGQLEESEQEIIDRAFVFADDTAVDVMLPRTELVGLPIDASEADVRRLITEERRDHYPVYEGDSDHIAGVLHARDALATLAAGESLDLRNLIRPVLQVPESLPLDRLLESLREARTHVALVVDEFGGTAGIVELKRVIERLVGSLPDEFTPLLTEETLASMNGQALGDALDGLMLVQDVNATYDLSLDETRAHTIGGLVFYELGRTPAVGDTVVFDRARFTVLEMDGLRISRLLLDLAGAPPEVAHVVDAG